MKKLFTLMMLLVPLMGFTVGCSEEGADTPPVEDSSAEPTPETDAGQAEAESDPAAAPE